MKAEKRLFRYTGAVLLYGKPVSDCWTAETYAVSEKKATSNLEFRYKRNFGYTSTALVKLAGKPVVADAST